MTPPISAEDLKSASTVKLPAYKSHKIVHAAQIGVLLPSLTQPLLVAEAGGAVAVPADPDLPPILLSPAYVSKHEPQAGGYYVRYGDGYESYSPAEAFESGYTALPPPVQVSFSEAWLETKLQELKLNAPRVKPADLDALIKDTKFEIVVPGKFMVCVLTLQNGFQLSGESWCVSPENFNEEIGRSVSLENARDKIWQLAGYTLAERLYQLALRSTIAADYRFNRDANTMLSDEAVAEICHEANRAYCLRIGDDSHKPWNETPENIRASVIQGVRNARTNPNASPGDSHRSWLKFKEDEGGWQYGPEKDLANKIHPCFLPFEQLPKDDQQKDINFLAIVRALS